VQAKTVKAQERTGKKRLEDGRPSRFKKGGRGQTSSERGGEEGEKKRLTGWVLTPEGKKWEMGGNEVERSNAGRCRELGLVLGALGGGGKKRNERNSKNLSIKGEEENDG